MNKKNRVLSFVMALIMVLGVMAVLPITIGAANFDYRNLESANFDVTKSSVAVSLDGAITPGEYTTTASTKPKADKNGAECSYTVTHHYAYDGDYVYVGIEFPQIAAAASNVVLMISPSPILDNANASLSHRSEECIALYVPGANVEGTSPAKMAVFHDSNYRSQNQRSELSMHVDRDVFGTAGVTPDASEFDSCFLRDAEATTTAVLEFKVSKAKLAESIELPDGTSAGITAEDIITFRYNVLYPESGTLSSGITNARLCAPLTYDEIETARMSTVSISVDSEKSWTHGQGANRFALCINLNAVDFDYRNIESAKALELNTRADIEQDGAIGADEYDLSFESVSMTCNDTNTVRGNVRQYLSHDEDYIYLGVEFIDGVAYSKNGQYIHLDIAAFQNFSNAAASYLYASKGALTFKGVNGAQTLAFPVVAKRDDVGTADTSAFGSGGVLDENLFYSFIKKGDNYTAVAEFKISKAALAAAGGMKASQIETFRYSIAFTDYIDTNDDGANDSSIAARVGASLTADELTAAIATHANLSSSESWVRSNLAYFAQCINIEYPENYFDYREYAGGEMYGLARNETIDLGKTDYAPNITDGKVSPGEYADKTQGKALGRLDQANDVDSSGAASSARDNVMQYLAHDDDWIYMAFELPDYNPNEVAYIYMFPLQEFQNAAASYYQYEYLLFKFDANGDTLIYSAKGSEADIDIHVNADGITSDTYSGKLTTTDLGDGKYSAVIEAKFSKAALAEAAGEKLKNFKNFRYMLRYDNTRVSGDRFVCWPSYIYADLANTSEKLTTTGESGKININHWTSFWGISVNLDYKYAFDYRNYDSANHNLYLDKSIAASSKGLDGIIGADEYSMSFDVTPMTANGTLRTDSVASNQYLSHDADYIYIGAVLPNVFPSNANEKYSIRFNMSPLQYTTDSITSFFYGDSLTKSAKESISFTATSLDTKLNLASRGDQRSLPVHADSDSIAVFGTSGQVPYANKFDSVINYNSETRTAVIEIKISKQAIADAGKLDSVEELLTFRYNFKYYFQPPAGGRLEVGLAPSFTSDELTELIYNSTSLGASQDSWTRSSGQNCFGFSINLKNYVNIETADLGSVRIGDSKNTSGLRFQTTVSKSYIKDLEKQGYTVSVGTIIALASNMPTFDSDGPVGNFIDVVAYLDTPYASNADTITFAGSIVNIKESHFATAFTAVGYIKLVKDGVTTYVYSNAVTKQVNLIAQAALNDANAEFTEGERVILQYFANSN